MVSENATRLAVLIDADNAQPAIAEGLLAEVAKFGTAHVKRAYGDWTGKPIKRLAKEPLWRVVQSHPSAVRFPGPDGESLPGVQERAVAAIRDWNERLGPKAAYLVCSHGDVIKSIIADSLGLHLDMFQRIQVDPCSVSVIRYTPLRPFVLRMNDTGAAVGGLARGEPAAGAPGQEGGQATGRSGLGEGDAVIGGGAGG